jgi:hypothetical protein
VLEGLDIVVGEDFGELVTAVERQDGVKRIEFGGAFEHGVAGNRGAETFCHRHIKPLVCLIYLS